MKSILAAIVTALLVALLATQSLPVSAQQNVNLDGKQKADAADAAVKGRQRKEVDSNYKSATERLPDKKLDPWRNLR
jgi:hypothetical protein